MPGSLPEDNPVRRKNTSYFSNLNTNSKMKFLLTSTAILCIIACSNVQTNAAKETNGKTKHFKGAISNGMKGDSLSFDISPDGKKLTNLTFHGWWRCSGKLERQPFAGPKGSYDIVNGKVEGSLAEPPNGGSTSWVFALRATIKGNTASGIFRMNINNLGCDTYELKFEASSY
jgi:hypothetical protein